MDLGFFRDDPGSFLVVYFLWALGDGGAVRNQARSWVERMLLERE